MTVRMSQYGREMDKSMSGKSMMAQHKRAVHKASVTTKEDKFDKPSVMDTMILAGLKGTKRIRRKKEK